MSGLNLAYWISFAVMWAITLGATVSQAKWRRRLQQATAKMTAKSAELNEKITEQMLRPSQLEAWAKWTMLTVTDRRGDIFACTLRQLYDDREVKERVWSDPIMVSIWQAEEGVHQKWQEEAEKLFKQVGPPEETPGA